VRQPDYSRRVVVTGLGVISPVGNDIRTAWSNLVNGVSGLGVISRFDSSPYPTHVSGEVQDFDPSPWMEAKAIRRSESAMWYGVAAAKQAIADAGLEINDENREDIGVVFGSGAGGQQLMIDNWHLLQDKGARSVAPTFIANGLVDSTSGMIAIETGAIGHNMCIVTACSTGTNSVGEAAELIRRGDVHTVIAGSTEMPLLEVAHAGFGNMRGLGSPRAEGEPLADTSRPFDRTRNGFVLGEGAGGLILEDLELAMARGARIYAEVVGYGSTADGHDMVQPIERGSGSARAMRIALERRGVPADEVDVINPHGTSTPVGDHREADVARQRHEVHDRSHDGRRRRLRGLRDRHDRRRADGARHDQLPRVRPRVRRVGPPGDGPAARALRPLQQHRPRRAQRRDHLQALGRPLIVGTIRATPTPSSQPSQV
jgi:3-oxoacyl-[acyl-carrier-protein] synthase II